MWRWRMRRQAREEHERAERELAANQAELVDMATRLVRLEAEVDIYRPFFVGERRIVA